VKSGKQTDNQTDAQSVKQLVRRCWAVFIFVLVVTLGLEFTMHPHNYFDLANTPFFNAWFGFVSCVVIVLVSKFLGIFLKRKEDYYSKKAGEGS